MAKWAVVGDVGAPVTAPCSLCGHTAACSLGHRHTPFSACPAWTNPAEIFLWKLPLQERDWPWRYYFASVRKGYFRLIPLKGKLQTSDCFLQPCNKVLFEAICPWGRTYKRYTPVTTSCSLLGKNHSSSAGSLLQSDSLMMFILHYDAGLVHSLPNYYVAN